MQAIEKKPALGASGNALEAAAAEGGRKGAVETVDALRASQRAFSDAQRSVDEHVSVLNRLSWYGLLAVVVGMLGLGTVAGASLGVWLFPSSLMSTKPGCALGGGLFVPAKGQNPDACVYWAKPAQ